MTYKDISRAYEMCGRETAYRTVCAEIERDYRADKVDLREKRELDAENRHRYINTPTEDELAMHPVTRNAEYWIDEEAHVRYKRIGKDVFRQCGDIWRFDYAGR